MMSRILEKKPLVISPNAPNTKSKKYSATTMEGIIPSAFMCTRFVFVSLVISMNDLLFCFLIFMSPFFLKD